MLLYLNPWLVMISSTNYPLISDMDEWKTEIRTNGGAVQDYTISYQNLDPLTTYYFRVIAYNQYGISEPCTTDETVKNISLGCKKEKKIFDITYWYLKEIIWLFLSLPFLSVPNSKSLSQYLKGKLKFLQNYFVICKTKIIKV